MARFDFDLLVIGAGSGGVRAARVAAGLGARVAVAEMGRVGGTCVIRGCVPKKLMVLGAQFADAFQDAEGFGWRVAETEFAWGQLVANKNREVDRLNGVYVNLLRGGGVRLLDGRAVVVDAHAVDVAGRLHTAAHILIATGSAPYLPPIPGIAHAITSDQALDLMEQPRRLVIIGGGRIAAEFSGIFHALGTEVTLVARGERLLRGFDDDLRVAFHDELARRGLVVRAGRQVERIERAADHYALTLDDGLIVRADLVLCATGRRPCTAGIGLEAAGVALDDGGAVVTDEHARSSVPSIHAVGDAAGRMNLTPVALAEGEAFARTVFGREPATVDYANVPTAVFSLPPIATVGLTEARAREGQGGVDVFRSRFRPMRHALSGRDERVLMKLVVDRRTGRVLGCHMIGADAPEIIQGLAVALRCGATKAEFDSTLGIHPTAAEEFVTMRAPDPPP